MALKETKTKQLYRSEKNRIVAGVAGGLGEYFNVDPTLVRLLFILMTVSGGSGVLLYLILWIIVPSESGTHGMAASETVEANTKEVEQRAKTFAHEAESWTSRSDTRFWGGLILALIGCWFLLTNLGILSVYVIGKLWPVTLIVIGLALWAQSERKK